MFCIKCSTPLPEGSAFCNHCGAAQGPAAAMKQPLAHAAPITEPEQELWRGGFSGKALGHWWALWFLELPLLLVIWFKLSDAMLGKPWTKWVFIAAAALPPLLIFWEILVQKIAIRYRLTTHRLFRTRGILSRQHNEIELVRVDDVSVRQNLIQRVFNVGIITVISPHDQTEPHLELVGIENPIEVKELIRTHVRRRRQGSLNVENL